MKTKMSTHKLLTHLIGLEKESKKIVSYVGRILLLRVIFTSYATGPKRTWEECFDEVLDTLSQREKRVLEMRFGLTGSPKTLRATGKEFGLTRERIRQIEEKAIRKLRYPSRKKVLLGISWQMAVQESKTMKKDLLKRLTRKGVCP